jgi:spiro-SPASM protein
MYEKPDNSSKKVDYSYENLDKLYKKSDSTANFMPLSKFEEILDKIIDFAGDGVVDISLWGEPALHPQAEALIRAVLDRPALSLVVETSGLGWGGKALESLTDAPPRTNGMAPVSWIVSLDAFDETRYREVRGGDYGEAVQAAERIGGLFPGSTYIQAVRVKGSEDDIEKFYRFWKDKGFKVIIQKYNNFAGLLPDLQTADLSPLRRNPCWHLARDFPVLIDGSVPRCFADCGRSEGRGNIFTESMETIWKRGEEDYRAHTLGNYPGICPKCDEYYTFNF